MTWAQIFKNFHDSLLYDLVHELFDKSYMLIRCSAAQQRLCMMMIKMTSDELERKLKRERVEVCINCKNFVECDNIGKFEECVDFGEVEDNVCVAENLISFSD